MNRILGIESRGISFTFRDDCAYKCRNNPTDVCPLTAASAKACLQATFQFIMLKRACISVNMDINHVASSERFINLRAAR